MVPKITKNDAIILMQLVGLDSFFWKVRTRPDPLVVSPSFRYQSKALCRQAWFRDCCHRVAQASMQHRYGQVAQVPAPQAPKGHEPQRHELKTPYRFRELAEVPPRHELEAPAQRHEEARQRHYELA
jgi:hypothetical protein